MENTIPTTDIMEAKPKVSTPHGDGRIINYFDNCFDNDYHIRKYVKLYKVEFPDGFTDLFYPYQLEFL